MPDGVRLVSYWLGKDEAILLRPVANPNSYLARLLELYWEGLQRPLPFFPRSALVYVKKCLSNGKNKLPPEEAARYTWEGSEQQRGECEDPYYRLAFRGSQPLNEEFYGLAAEIFGPLLEHLQK
jgi:exodeoxyribonuclease V gamma subunit